MSYETVDFCCFHIAYMFVDWQQEMTNIQMQIIQCHHLCNRIYLDDSQFSVNNQQILKRKNIKKDL